MKIKTLDFKKAIDTAKPALASKEIIEQSGSFVFHEGSIMAFNDEIFIQSPIGVENLSGAIKAEELYKSIAKIKEETIDILPTDSEVVIKSGRSKSGFALSPEILLPIDEIEKPTKWNKIPEDFLRACKFAAASASRDASNAKLTCVHINKAGVIEASDDNRLIIWKFKTPFQIDSTLIPATSVKEALKIQPTEFSRGTGWIHFRNENKVSVSCRILEESYMDTAPIVAQIKKMKSIEFPDNIIPILEKAEIFQDGQKTDETVTLTFANGKLSFFSESSTAWFKEFVATDVEDEFSFSITPYLLKDILKETNKGAINENMLVFKNENWQYITSLRQFNGE